ncbi:MAG: zinc-ribbon domain-containing protein, partial [Gemmataceae bacterium]|nr:zinc-ribbon domain-containing protein [Gemmataceae bacterium]
MPVPIKCPGCQAAFDVPDHLAGKKIRCTSCKAEVAVPAGKVAAATGSAERKPVPVASKPPAAAARPANGKPAARASVVLDDDDDDDRPRKAKPADAKPVKAAAVRAVADDDDDDADDRPARRKPGKGKAKAKDNGYGMLYLIGGAVVGIAAIAGVAVALLSGDKKKDETASSSGSANTPAPTMPAGGPQPGMRPGGPPAGGGGA